MVVLCKLQKIVEYLIGKVLKKHTIFRKISKEDLVTLQNTDGGLIPYVQKGGKLPPVELIKDCQQKIYDFCRLENTEINRGVTHYGKNTGETPLCSSIEKQGRLRYLTRLVVI